MNANNTFVEQFFVAVWAIITRDTGNSSGSSFSVGGCANHSFREITRNDPAESVISEAKFFLNKQKFEIHMFFIPLECYFLFTR